MKKSGKPAAALLQPSKVVCEVWSAMTVVCAQDAGEQGAYTDRLSKTTSSTATRLWEWQHMTGTGHLFFNKPCRQIP